jgi:ABC-type glycerol-3-phosphate transport system substrate-binding protein
MMNKSQRLKFGRILVLLGAFLLVLAACSGGEGEETADLPEATGAAVFEYVTETNDYTNWGT